MDPTDEIKAKLPIDELVSQYCQLHKKGRNFVCLCPFHNDKHPSMLVSPDKGIAYCFVCNSGGDIFSFYQAIEGVGFRQALKDLADKTGVNLPEAPQISAVKKDEKDRFRQCLEAAGTFYMRQLATSEKAKKYVKDRGLSAEEITTFRIGASPDSFSTTYEHLLKEGFSKSEILGAGLGVQKDLQTGKIYDRFRNRLMFPIHDHQGNLVGFGGRALGEEDAKYINSAEGPLYNKSQILYGLYQARDAIRASKKVVMVEGYFDVIACHRVGVTNVVAVSGTALTEQHVKLLKRWVDTVVLCLDQDRAGQEAAQRSFTLCSAEGLHVQQVSLEGKDPDEVAKADAEALKTALESGGKAYLDSVIDLLEQEGVSSIESKRAAMSTLLPLYDALSTEVEREHYMQRMTALFGSTQTALKKDIEAFQQSNTQRGPVAPVEEKPAIPKKDAFNKVEVTLGLLLHYPQHLSLLDHLIEPPEGFSGLLYHAMRKLDANEKLDIDALDLPQEDRERTSILYLYCEHHCMTDWTESLALRELKKNCLTANRMLLAQKQKEIKRQLIEARREGRKAEEEQLNNQFTKLLKLSHMAE